MPLLSGYTLTPETDPSAFTEEKDGEIYHLCDFPLHTHHVPFPFAACYDQGAWTWESKYSW